jgi:hypothetical protein
MILSMANESIMSPFCGLRGDTFLQSPHLILSSDTSLPHGPGAAVGFGRGVGLGVGLGVGEGVAVGVAVAVDAPVACDGCNVAVGVSKPRATDLSIREARNRP